MLFEDNNLDINMSLFMPDINIKNFNRDTNFLEAEEGFLRGNMFRNEYVPYKNLTYLKLNPKNEKEKLLYHLMAVSFAITDLNLYLDLHPDCKEAFELFKRYVKEKRELTQEYVKMYEPTTVTKTTGTKYTWINSPWPWDKTGGSLYV